MLKKIQTQGDAWLTTWLAIIAFCSFFCFLLGIIVAESVNLYFGV